MLIVAGFFLASCAATNTDKGGNVDAASSSASSSSGGEVTIHFIDITGYNERVIPTPRDGSDPAWSPLL